MSRPKWWAKYEELRCHWDALRWRGGGRERGWYPPPRVIQVGSVLPPCTRGTHWRFNYDNLSIVKSRMFLDCVVDRFVKLWRWHSPPAQPPRKCLTLSILFRRMFFRDGQLTNQWKRLILLFLMPEWLKAYKIGAFKQHNALLSPVWTAAPFEYRIPSIDSWHDLVGCKLAKVRLRCKLTNEDR